jgi:hypothetical protein
MNNLSNNPTPSGKASHPPEEPQHKTLNDLFLKTKTLPSIYYMPLTESQVAEKLNKGHHHLSAHLNK